ncbi:DDB1- and CUL4-associated factor 8-like [Ctenodactylus gundi]
MSDQESSTKDLPNLENNENLPRSSDDGPETETSVAVAPSEAAPELTGDSVETQDSDGSCPASLEGQAMCLEGSGDSTGSLAYSASEEDSQDSEEEAEQPQVGALNPEDSNDEPDSENDKALEEWIVSETSALPQPRWRVVPALWQRQLGLAPRFAQQACGSRVFVQHFELQHHLEGHEGCVNTVHFSHHGRWLASGGDDLNVMVWDWMHKTPVSMFRSGHRNNIFQAKFLPNSNDSTLAICGRDGQVRVANLMATPVTKNSKRVVKHRGPSHRFALEPDSPFRLLTSGEDGVVYSVDLRGQSPPSKLVTVKESGKIVGLYAICLNPANLYQFAVSGRDQFVRIYDQRKITECERSGLLKKFCPHHLLPSECKPSITCVEYNHNGTELLASYNDEDIYLFNSSDGDGAQYAKRYKGHRNHSTVKGVNFYGPGSEFVMSSSDCGHVFFWEKTSCQIVHFLEADKGSSVNCLDPHPYLPVLATSSLDREIKIWAPTATTPAELCGLKNVMKVNKQKRDEDVAHHLNLFESHMLWFLMNRGTWGTHHQDGRIRFLGEAMSESSSTSLSSEEEN